MREAKAARLHAERTAKAEAVLSKLQQWTGESLFERFEHKDAHSEGYGYVLDREPLRELGFSEEHLDVFEKELRATGLIPRGETRRVWIGHVEPGISHHPYGTEEEADRSTARAKDDRVRERHEMSESALAGKAAAGRGIRGSRRKNLAGTSGGVRLAGGKMSHQNAAIAEAHGFKHATDTLGQVGIARPGPTTGGKRADFITFDPSGAGHIVLWDSKYRGPGGSYPKTIPPDKVARWTKVAEQTINGLPDGPLKTQALEALRAGRVRAEIFKWPQ